MMSFKVRFTSQVKNSLAFSANKTKLNKINSNDKISADSLTDLTGVENRHS